MAHDKSRLRVVGGHLVQGEGVAIFQVGPGEGGQTHVDGHRLIIPGGQVIDGLIAVVRQPDAVIAGVELHPAAVVPL